MLLYRHPNYTILSVLLILVFCEIPWFSIQFSEMTHSWSQIGEVRTDTKTKCFKNKFIPRSPKAVTRYTCFSPCTSCHQVRLLFSLHKLSLGTPAFLLAQAVNRYTCFSSCTSCHQVRLLFSLHKLSLGTPAFLLAQAVTRYACFSPCTSCHQVRLLFSLHKLSLGTPAFLLARHLQQFVNRLTTSLYLNESIRHSK